MAAHGDLANFTVADLMALLIQQLNLHPGCRPSHRQPAGGNRVVEREAELGDIAGFRRGKRVQQDAWAGKCFW